VGILQNAIGLQNATILLLPELKALSGIGIERIGGDRS
jgi:hypothetical protein